MGNAINYASKISLESGKLIDKKTGIIMAEQKKDGMWRCTCGYKTANIQEIFAHVWSLLCSLEKLPESDGQAEQHLGAVTEVWWDEMTQTVRECKPNCEGNELKTKWQCSHCGGYLESERQLLSHIHVRHGIDLEEPTQQPTNKYDNGKPRLDLVPPAIIEAVGEIRTYGNKKYGDSESWHTVEPARYRAAMMRHLCAYLRDPTSKDEESGLSHLSHMACNVAFLLELEKEGKV